MGNEGYDDIIRTERGHTASGASLERGKGRAVRPGIRGLDHGPGRLA